MGRTANQIVTLPQGVESHIDKQCLTIKGKKGELSLNIVDEVGVRCAENTLHFSIHNRSKQANALLGTMRALTYNMVRGVSDGFSKKLILNGVGYRAKVSGDKIVLSLGFSHDISYTLPKEIQADVKDQTEITLSGIDKQQLGQVAAEIRAHRPPEPYKGKGVRYAEEHVRRKETKKK